MHFGRSHARSKSRSPAPAVDSQIYTPQSSRPPAFLPPSHYAAAAGLPVSGDTRASLEQYSPALDHSNIAYPALDETPSPDSADTSSHFGAVGRLIGRTSGKRSTASLVRSDSKGDKEKDLRDKSKSQFGGLPLLEAHLLPSLRDTVDRMTQLPRSPIDQSESAESYQAPSTHSAFSTRIPRSTPEPSPATNIPRLRTQASPTPKSALKSPSRRGTVSNTIASGISSPKHPPPSTRTHHTHSAPPQEAQLELGTGLAQRTRNDRSRNATSMPSSALKPIPPNVASALPKRKSDARSKSNPSTPQNAHRYSVFATPQPERPTGSPHIYSSLPKPKSSRRDHPVPNDSGSELERQVGRALTPGRLMVTNAVIVPSSSESDHEAKVRNRRSQWLKQTPLPSATTSRAPSRQPSRSQVHRDACVIPVGPPRSRVPMAVGLGLKVDEDFGYRGRFPIDDDEASIYENESDTHSLIMDEPALAEDDDDSIYAGDPPRQDSFQRRSPLPHRQAPSEGRLRQEALRGIVDGLHRDYGGTHDLGGDNEFVQSGSEDGGSIRGLAIGGSADLRHEPSEESSSLSRGPLLHRKGNAFYESEASQSDDESAYSDHDGYDATHTRNGDDYRLSPRPEDYRSAESARPPGSLRQNRTSWKRPSSSLGVHERRSSDRRSPSPSSQAADSRRSRSPLLASSSPREPAVEEFPTSRKPPHTRSKSSYERSPTSRRDPGKDAAHTSKRNSHQKQPAESSSRSSRLLSPSPRMSNGHSHRPQDTGARERLGFGIPESLSYGGNTTPDESEVVSRPPLSRLGSASSVAPGISRADSDLSVADVGWQDQVRVSRELSKGAAALFDALESKTARTKGRPHRRYDNDEQEQDRTPLADHGSWDPHSSRQRSASTGIPRRHTKRHSPDTVSVSTASSPPSEYEENTSPVSEPEPEETPLSPPQVLIHEPSSSWKSTLSDDVYHSLSRHYGHEEMERQELIYAFCTSENAFVRSARRVVRTVLLPLRSRESRAWLPGLPAEVARLFDWIEDIVNLHAAIARALSTVAGIWQTGSIVQRVAGTLKGFVPRLETYMPYLAKYEGLKEVVRWHAEQDGGEFGEYLRMAERERAEDEWPLQKLFDEPYTRLRSYLDVFQHLHEMTPQGHPDYLAMTSLLYSTRTAIRVMEEVKAREEEYDFVKDLSSRIDGLPVSQALARRSRRLLWFGMLVQAEGSDEGNAQYSSGAPTTANEALSPRSNQGAPGRSPARGERTSVKLATAIRDWTARRSRVGSFGSSASSALSVQTFDSTSTASSASLLATPRSDQFPGTRPPGRASSKGHARSPQVARATQGTPLLPQAEDVPLNVMVFSDLVVLAVPNVIGNNARAQDGDQEQRSRLADGIGLSRIIGVTENGDRSVRLSLIPVPPDQLDTGITVENTSPVDITLSLPHSLDPTSKPDDLVKALRKCYHHTVRGLSYPALPTVVTDDLELDTRQSLVGILSAGLPLPKSPSMQFDTAGQEGAPREHGEKEDRARGEREERGWWTLRFQQVLREFQREDVPVAVAGEWAAAGIREQRPSERAPF